jgi:repressor LexA
MIKLTARQQQVFELVLRAIERTGFPPTRAEIAAELGFSSANAAEEHLRALARKGVIELAPGASRGIRVVLGRESNRESGRDDGFAEAAVPHPSMLPMSLPLIGRVAAGSPILAQEHILRQYGCDPAMFSSRPDYLLQVRGLSMRDAGILDGDLLAVQRRKEANEGQIVVARLGDEVTVKRLHRTATGIELLAENPDYAPIVVDRERTDFELEGIAVGLIRPSQL